MKRTKKGPQFVLLLFSVYRTRNPTITVQCQYKPQSNNEIKVLFFVRRLHHVVVCSLVLSLSLTFPSVLLLGLLNWCVFTPSVFFAFVLGTIFVSRFHAFALSLCFRFVSQCLSISPSFVRSLLLLMLFFFLSGECT